ncbi:uncharacterized protein C8A04DRAFT_30670 [Dichotomopilus funicola]|uniref:Protein kinase domain-containing protein n=1 Tax=Dichotomopilus funicola TaxID=1934379 RepID=A0AAN6ZL68_9PEZI|nr:hypothetical protein C8A04DRAFT_30670 [Dichotomopilus funicola]
MGSHTGLQTEWVIWDWDQRRSLDVLIPRDVEDEFIYEALTKFIDTIPPDVTQVTLDEHGALVVGSSDPHDTRVFKLKYLQQLINTVDYLNLTLGIVHGDICPWNPLIDPTTDNLQLFDFNSAAKLGWDGDEANNVEFQYDPDRNDVKFTIFTIHQLITREFSFRQEFYPEELDASEIMSQETWDQHPDSKLDSPVEAYRQLLSEWVERRAVEDKKVDHFSKAAQPLEWPALVDDPFLDADGTPLWRWCWMGRRPPMGKRLGDGHGRHVGVVGRYD